MDQSLREMLQQAYALDDAARAFCEPTERTVTRRDIVYKTYETPQQSQATTMHEASSQAWNDWLDKRLRNNNTMLANVIGEEVALRENALRQEVRELQNQIGHLRADLEIERRHKQARALIENCEDNITWPHHAGHT